MTSSSSEGTAKVKSNCYVCTACLHEQLSFLKPCEKCGSRKIEHVAFKRQQFGEHWQALLRADHGLTH